MWVSQAGNLRYSQKGEMFLWPNYHLFSAKMNHSRFFGGKNKCFLKFYKIKEKIFLLGVQIKHAFKNIWYSKQKYNARVHGDYKGLRLSQIILIYLIFKRTETLFWYSLFVQGFKSLEKYVREKDLRTLSEIVFGKPGRIRKNRLSSFAV